MAAAQVSAIDADSGVAADVRDDVDCARAIEGGGDDSIEEVSNRRLAKALHEEVMADVEAVLKKKEDLLWSRGRVELQSLREERAQVVSTLGDIQERQDQLLDEHSQMRGTLMDITMRLEHLAREMRDSLRVGPQQAGSASDGVDVFGGFDGGPLLHGGYDMVDPGAMAHFAPADAAMLDGPRTPTRAALGASSASSSAPPTVAPPLPGSPAVRLSLASALDASVTTTPPSQQSAKRLAIAECLDLDGPSDSTRKAAAESAVGSSWRPEFATDSPPSLHAGRSPWQLELSPVLDQASSSQLRSLRAEAPAFVPGAGLAAADNSTSASDAVAPTASTADVAAAPVVAASAPAGLRLERPPAQAENEEEFRDPSSP